MHQSADTRQIQLLKTHKGNAVLM